MRGYGQFCPLAKASEVLGERWTHLLIRELGLGSESFNDLRKGLPLISPSLLSRRLKSLEDAGIVSRVERNASIRYRLTAAGIELMPILVQLGTWGHRWVRSDLSAGDLDPGLLVWDIHRNLKTEFFTTPRTIIRIEFTDLLSSKRYWWLLVRNGEVEVCLKDPGFDVDLQIAADVHTLTAVWMGDTSLGKALRENRLQVSGASALRKNIAAWLGRSRFAEIKPAR